MIIFSYSSFTHPFLLLFLETVGACAQSLLPCAIICLVGKLLFCLLCSLYPFQSMAECQESEIILSKKKRLSLSLRRKPLSEKPVIEQGYEPPTKRFVETCDNEVHLSKKKPSCKKTERSQLWAFNVFKEWLKFHASGESEEPVVEYVEADLFSEDAEKVCAIMCKCVLEARQQNGNHYSPKTLLQLSTNLQSWALAQNPNACRFMDARDP